MEDSARAWHDYQSNPHNWSVARKYTVTLLLSALTFNTLMSSTIVAPALGQIGKDLAISSEAETQLVLSIYVLAYVIGHFFWAPLSEIYGRKKILQTANAWFCVWNLLCGFAKNEATMVIGRLMSGAGAAASLALGTTIMGEIWRPAQRGRSLAVLSVVTLLGPCIGPIIGGAIAGHSLSSWRWAFWSTTIFNAVLQLASLRLMHESHMPTILRKSTRNGPETVNQAHSSTTAMSSSLLLRSLERPFFLIRSQPVCQGLLVYTGLTFGSLYIVLTIIPAAFTAIYSQSIMVASLNYLSFGIGTTIGAQLCAPIIDHLYQWQTRKAHERASNDVHADDKLDEKHTNIKADPEIRLYPFVPTIFMMAAGLLICGWSLHFHQHWIIANVGIAVFGAGNQAMTQCTNAYIVDAFSDVKSHHGSLANVTASCVKNLSSQKTGDMALIGMQAGVNWCASAIASIWAAKALGGFVFPLFAPDMIKTLGYGWTFTLLAVLNVVIGLPVALIMLVYGKRLRGKGYAKIEQRMTGDSV